MAAPRAVREFNSTFDPWPVINAWAGETGYKPVGEGLYQKGIGFWVAPQMLQVQCQGTMVRVEAWIRAGIFVRMMSLFILPAEITIESGGMKAAIPRKMARKDVNKLMERLQQPQLA